MDMGAILPLPLMGEHRRLQRNRIAFSINPSVAKEVAGLNASEERDATRWVEAVSEFDER